MLSEQGHGSHEQHYEAYKIFREAQPYTDPEANEPSNGIIAPGATGVTFVTERASANGFKGNEDPDWANCGQGAPEVGPLEGGSERPMSIDLSKAGLDVMEYSPTAGTKELRAAVADLYNHLYRKDKPSQYSYKNVCIVPGGRAGLTRIAAIVGEVYTSFSVPEYTCYDSMLSVFRRLVPIPSVLAAQNEYKMNTEQLEMSIKNQGISVVVGSNPRNPTGTVTKGEELETLVELARAGPTTLVLDEFYSWYHYDEKGRSYSAAEHVQDVNQDPVIMLDGLTKNWRLPGFRCCWIIGPEKVMDALSQSGSFLDGGTSHPIQVAAVPLLQPSRVEQDIKALQKHFKMKRDFAIDRLQKMGFKVTAPSSTFYIWLNLEGLPKPLDSGITFFEELLMERVIVVPGIFFDVNPQHRRNLVRSPCHHYVRLSFGPSMDHLEKAMDGIERLLKKLEVPEVNGRKVGSGYKQSNKERHHEVHVP